MADESNQRAVHSFLVEHLRSQAPFTREDLRGATTWNEKTFTTYWSKHYRPFVIDVGSGRFRVTEAFRRYAGWDRFQDHVTQMRRASADYISDLHESLIIYEFFMPLTHEESLRNSLDALFYKDMILSRLAAHEDALARHFPRESGETSPAHLARAAGWVSEQFVGYSVSHVNGRFRAGKLLTIADAGSLQEEGVRYLVDETTAVVRFIFPVRKAMTSFAPLSAAYFEALTTESDPSTEDIAAEAARIRWFFGVLFVESIVQAVNGEAEIWMVESGMRNRLHIWRVREDG